MKWLRFLKSKEHSAHRNSSDSAISEKRISHPVQDEACMEFINGFIEKAQFDSNVVNGSEALQLGIEAHENYHLEKSCVYFALAAKAGLPLGVFLFALSLRNGWGCDKNDKIGFSLLRQTAEFAIMEIRLARLEETQSNAVQQAAQQFTRSLSRSSKLEPIDKDSDLNRFTKTALTELIISLLELAQCFRHGWGCPKSKQAFLYYLEIAARLEDVDAQIQLADCYLNGSCTKRDKQKAAFWYREAEKNGARLYNIHWVHKQKYL